MAKESTINLRIDAADRELLDVAAQADDRPVAAIVRRVLSAWLHGTKPPTRDAVEAELKRRERVAKPKVGE